MRWLDFSFYGIHVLLRNDNGQRLFVIRPQNDALNAGLKASFIKQGFTVDPEDDNRLVAPVTPGLSKKLFDAKNVRAFEVGPTDLIEEQAFLAARQAAVATPSMVRQDDAKQPGKPVGIPRNKPRAQATQMNDELNAGTIRATDSDTGATENSSRISGDQAQPTKQTEVAGTLDSADMALPVNTASANPLPLSEAVIVTPDNSVKDKPVIASDRPAKLKPVSTAKPVNVPPPSEQALHSIRSTLTKRMDPEVMSVAESLSTQFLGSSVTKKNRFAFDGVIHDIVLPENKDKPSLRAKAVLWYEKGEPRIAAKFGKNHKVIGLSSFENGQYHDFSVIENSLLQPTRYKSAFSRLETLQQSISSIIYQAEHASAQSKAPLPNRMGVFDQSLYQLIDFVSEKSSASIVLMPYDQQWLSSYRYDHREGSMMGVLSKITSDSPVSETRDEAIVLQAKKLIRAQEMILKSAEARSSQSFVLQRGEALAIMDWANEVIGRFTQQSAEDDGHRLVG